MYALVYRFYAAWIAARVLVFDADRTTPAVLLFTGTFMILIALISALGLTAVDAMKHSPWGTATVAASMPIAMLIGLYRNQIRSGRVLEVTLIGRALLLITMEATGSTRSRWFEPDSTGTAHLWPG